MDEIQIDTSGIEDRRKVRADNLYELMFDQYGQVKTNIGKKAVVRSDCLELLETGGKAIGFETLSSTKEAATYEAMRLNKSLKLVNTIPHFQSVPATAHLFDLAGSGIQYPESSEQARDDAKGRWFGSIGSFFGRK